MDVYIGLDQSLCNTGVAIYHEGEILTTNFTTSVNKTDKDYARRLYEIEMFLVLLNNKFKPKKYYIEQIFVNNIKGGTLAKVEAVVQRFFLLENINYNSMSAAKNHKNSWPKALGIKGAKEHCKTLIDSITKEDLKLTSHEYDAIGIVCGGLLLEGIISVNEINALKINHLNAKQFKQYLSEV